MRFAPELQPTNFNAPNVAFPPARPRDPDAPERIPTAPAAAIAIPGGLRSPRGPTTFENPRRPRSQRATRAPPRGAVDWDAARVEAGDPPRLPARDDPADTAQRSAAGRSRHRAAAAGSAPRRERSGTPCAHRLSRARDTRSTRTATVGWCRSARELKIGRPVRPATLSFLSDQQHHETQPRTKSGQ
jgi:hypothetical protein